MKLLGEFFGRRLGPISLSIWREVRTILLMVSIESGCSVIFKVLRTFSGGM